MVWSDKQRDACQRAAALCSRSERSPGSIEQKLHDWGLAEEEARPVLERLVHEKFIDQERFARSFVRDKFRFNKWGKIKLAFHLKAEKIAPDIIRSALEEIGDEVYHETLVRLLTEKDKSVKALNLYDRKAKLFRFAQSRGFETDLIYSALAEMVGD